MGDKSKTKQIRGALMSNERQTKPKKIRGTVSSKGWKKFSRWVHIYRFETISDAAF